MTSSVDTNQLTTIPSKLTDCVYILPSADDSGRFKLGVTSRLAARVASLRQSDGPLDLDRAVVVAAKDRRAAFDLEGVLKTVFDAPVWRTAADGPAYNGSSEWYTAATLEPMVALVGEMIARDERCGVRRFAFQPRTPWLAAWCEQARGVRRVRRWTEEELSAENARMLARAEGNFARLQAWMAARQDALVEVRVSAADGAAGVGRVFLFAGDERTVMDGMVDEEFVKFCLVSRRHTWGAVTFSFLGSAGPDPVRPGAYGVAWMVTEAFGQAAGFSPGLDALLTRIKGWICRESF